MRNPPAEPAYVEIDGRRTRNFICLVDIHRRPGRCRNTRGRYRVGAKNAKQAKELLQKAIGFGSIQVYYEDNTAECSDLVRLGECRRETWNESTERFDQSEVRHACDPCGEAKDVQGRRSK